MAQLVTGEAFKECIGKAAFAADLLAETGTRDVRTKDFDDIARVDPLACEFTGDELSIINSFDKHAAIK